MKEPSLKYPAREEIERRAYELYLQRGGQDGGDMEDWLAAETELSEQHSEQISSNTQETNETSAEKYKAVAAGRTRT